MARLSEVAEKLNMDISASLQCVLPQASLTCGFVVAFLEGRQLC
eukprot:COSAG04_NODE_2009_length_5010_cov_3.534514_4_plen_44_part_00